MFRMLTVAAAAAFSIPSIGLAATSETSKSFIVSMNCEQFVKWYEANRNGVLDASNCRVLSKSAHGEYTVVTSTPVGDCTYVIKETRAKDRTRDGRNRTTYHITYVRNVSGRVVDQDLTIALTDLPGKTEINMSITTSVAGRFVPVFAVRDVQNNCLAGSKRFITAKAH